MPAFVTSVGTNTGTFGLKLLGGGGGMKMIGGSWGIMGGGPYMPPCAESFGDETAAIIRLNATALKRSVEATILPVFFLACGDMPHLSG